MQHVQIDASGLTIADRDGLDLPILQHLVGGAVAQAGYWPRFSAAGDLIAYANADWSTPNLPATVRIGDEVVYGPVVLAGVDGQGRERALTDAELDRITLERSNEGGVPRLVIDMAVSES